MNHLWAGYGTWGILSSSCVDGQVQTSIYMYTIHMYMHILCTHINIITNEAPPFSAKLGRRMSKLVLSGFAWVSCLWSLWPGKYIGVLVYLCMLCLCAVSARSTSSALLLLNLVTWNCARLTSLIVSDLVCCIFHKQLMIC